MSRVTEVRHIGYAVVDFAAERRFYVDDWGLQEVADEHGVVYLAAQGHDEKYVVRLRQATLNQIDVISLAADRRSDVDDLHVKVSAYGCRTIFSPRLLTTPGGGYGFRFFTPDGLPFEVSADVEKGPARPLARWEGIPQKISHVVIHSPDHLAAVNFFTEVLGFRVSDWIGDFLCFLRCNEWHHRIGIMPGPASVNHVAYDMPSVDDMMRGVSRLKTRGVAIQWGPGRHTAGNNTFSYFTTPSGAVVEYTSDLEQVHFDDHQAKVHPPGPETVDQWRTGVGSPETMPHAAVDPGLFRPAEV